MRTKCEKCSGKGFVEYETQRNGGFYVQLYKCCDDAKYYAEVKRRHSKEAQVIGRVFDFPSRTR